MKSICQIEKFQGFIIFCRIKVKCSFFIRSQSTNNDVFCLKKGKKQSLKVRKKFLQMSNLYNVCKWGKADVIYVTKGPNCDLDQVLMCFYYVCLVTHACNKMTVSRINSLKRLSPMNFYWRFSKGSEIIPLSDYLLKC